MNTNQSKKIRHVRKKSSRSKAKPVIAGVTGLALVASGVFLVAPAASAAPGSSEAEGRYLSGTLLGTSLDNIIEVAGERAEANANTGPVVTENGDLDLSVLGDTLALEVADGITIPLTVADAGVVGQYAQATQSGTARAASGAITDDGVIDVAPGSDAPGPLTLDLSNLIGDDLSNQVASLKLSAGVTSATADKNGIGAGVGDYSIASLNTTFTSPVVAGLSGDILTSGDLLETTVNGTLGPDGSLVSSLTDAVSSLGAVEVDSALNVDLNPVLEEVLANNQLLGAGGPVQVNLATGEVTVDIQALLAANGRDLNDLGPNEEILNSELVGFITADVDELVNGLLTEADAAVVEALQAATLTLGVQVGPADDSILNLSLNGTLGEIATGEVASTVTIGDTDFDPNILTGLIGTVVNGVLDAELSTVELDAALAGLYPSLDDVLTSLVSLQGNLQSTDAGIFTQGALRLTVLNSQNAAGELLSLNLAQAAVGPNVLPTEDTPQEVVPVALSSTPAAGPEAGGTVVTILGSGFVGTENVLFGDTAASFTVVSANEIRALTPAGTGLVDISVVKTSGTSTLTDAFTYIPASTGTGEPGVVISITPDEGPEVGGTIVTIVGEGFNGTDTVLFGNTPADSFIVVSDNEIVAVTPAGVGEVPVSIIGANDGDIVSTITFEYIPGAVTPPNGSDTGAVTAVSPTSGPEAGGTVVTIVGEGFLGADTVTFGGTPATETIVVSDTQIITVAPAGTGVVPIVIVGADSNDSITAPSSFTYIGGVVIPTLPVIDTVTPSTGPTTGGTVVTITGDNLGDVTNVYFNDVPGTNVSVVNGSVTVTTPPGVAGTADIRVVTIDGEEDSLENGFTYVVGTTPPIDGGDGVTIPAGNGGITYANCAAAKAAGAGALTPVDPGYSLDLDGDADGVACEENGPVGSSVNSLAKTGGDPLGGFVIAGILLLITGAGVFLFRRFRTAA